MALIGSFSGDYAFLSNFHVAPVEYEGAIYPTVEHAFQAAKTFNAEEREKVRTAATPATAKRLGRRMQLRPDWEEVKPQIMRELLRSKFAEPGLRQLLLDTRNAELVEGNTWHDKIWGRCTCARCNGKGRNLLGELLMAVRREMQEDSGATG